LGETGTARALLSAALAGDPRFLTALGRAYLTANEPAAATQAIRILRRSGETLQALRLEIRIELARKRFDEAIRLGLRAIAMAPSDPDLRLLAAEALWRRGRHGECMTILKPLLVTLPDGRMKARALAGYGAAALALGLPQEAATRLAAAEALAQRHAEAGLGDDILFNLALAERRRGEPRRAIALIERIQKRPGDADLIRAAALADLGRLSDAIAILEAAAPRSIIAALNYGILLRRGEMLNDSIRVLRSLARVWTGAPIVDYHLARSLESSGDLRAARQYYLAAAEAEADPSLSEVFRREAARMLALEAKP
jgi:tetratricopeptide (TPR) repeat protein